MFLQPEHNTPPATTLKFVMNERWGVPTLSSERPCYCHIGNRFIDRRLAKMCEALEQVLTPV